MEGDGLIDTFGVGHMVDFTYGMTLITLLYPNWDRCTLFGTGIPLDE